MKNLQLFKLLFVSFMIGGMFSCELRNDDPVPNLKSDQALEGMVIVSAGENEMGMPAELCGEPVILSLFKVGMDPEIGIVTVGNDEENLYVKVEITEECWEMDLLFMYTGGFDNIPMPLEGNYPAFWDFPVQRNFTNPVTSFTYSFPLAVLPDCPALIVKARVACNENQMIVWAMGTNPGWEQAAYYFEYCEEDCDGCKPGIYHTQTPGGWGAKPAGNNPGTYLAANFDIVFPGGLEVGGPNTITLTSASAIETLLPTGGKPAALYNSVVDPAKIKNVLVGHIVALTLSLGFDKNDPDFGEAEGYLGDLIIENGGDFDGWTVDAVLAEANIVLGGGESSFTPSQMTNMLTMINEYFVDGKLSAVYKLFKCVSVE